jgi:threonine dehydratase
MIPTLPELRTAAAQVYELLSPTPQYCWPLLCRRLGAQVWVKHENHLPVGAFKVRGGIVYLRKLRDEGVRDVIAATRGNHGQSVAWAARRFGMNATLVIPRGNSTEKNDAMRTLGATLIEHGHDFQEALEYAHSLAQQNGQYFIPSYSIDLVCGVASYALELFEAISDLDRIYVPIGLGSGICGVIAARQVLQLTTEIVGVVAQQAPAYFDSFREGSLVSSPVLPTIADGLACRTPNAEAFEIIKQHVARIVKVDEQQIREAMRIYFTDTHNIAEGAGAAALAAALSEKELNQNKRIAVVLSGGNVDRYTYLDALTKPDELRNTL